MTVCIAALCEDGEEPRAVVAADRMVTLGSFIEFEHAVPKMSPAATTAIAMVAGDTLLGNRLAADVANGFSGGGHDVDAIADALAQRYDQVRRGQIEEHLLRPRALDLQSFYQLHQSLSQQITMMLDNQIATLNLGVELLLAGVDPSGAHIHTIHNPGGTDRLHDIIGYAAIGSGAIHATQSLIGFQHSASAPYLETVFRTYASKRRSEVAPGVGHDTDMAVISDSEIHWLTEHELGQLEAIYDEFQTSTSAVLAEKLADFSLGEEKPPMTDLSYSPSPCPTLDPTLDPTLAVKIALVEVEVARAEAGLPPIGLVGSNSAAIRDLSPFGR